MSLADKLIESVMQERNTEYADAWATTGEVLKAIPSIAHGVALLLFNYPRMYFPWVMILNKLIRILGTPNKLDSWVDIAGYAQLVVNELSSEQDKGN